MVPDSISHICCIRMEQLSSTKTSVYKTERCTKEAIQFVCMEVFAHTTSSHNITFKVWKMINFRLKCTLYESRIHVGMSVYLLVVSGFHRFKT